MSLRSSFVQTSLGPLPADWDVVAIGDVGTVVRGASPRPAGDPRFFGGSFKPWLTVSGITNIPAEKIYVSETQDYLTEAGTKQSRSLRDDTIVIANSGYSLGVAKILNLNCCANDGVAAIEHLTKGNKQFICYCINFQTDHLREIVARGNEQPNLNTTLIREIMLPFPDESEQAAIANVLIDLDELLDSLNVLINKQREIFQGVLQNLLTGKVRLPGFTSEWSDHTLADIFQFLRSGTNARSDLSVGGEVGYIHYGDIHGSNSPRMDAADLPGISASKVGALPRVRSGDLVLADASEDYDGIGKSVEITNVGAREVVAGLHTLLLRGNPALITNGFKGYLQFIPELKAALIRVANGLSVFGISKSNLKPIRVSLPSIDEQAAIVAVLVDLDEEIDTLSRRIDKARALRAGTMQQLLTGRIRLI